MAINYLKNYYEILNITQDTTPQEVKDAYKNQALKYHPDKNIGIDTTELFRDVHDAYEVLKNNETRADYNANYQHPSFALFKEFVTRDMSILEVETYLDKGASINAHNAFNQTILMYATNRFKFDMVKFLSEHNASVNAVDGAGNTPLMYAAIKETVVFSTDNAAIIKERHQKHFERKKEPEENKTTPLQKEAVDTEEQIDLTQPPIMEGSIPSNILQTLWESTIESIALCGSIEVTNYVLRGMSPRYKLLIESAIVFSVHYEFIMKLGYAIYGSISHYSPRYRIKLTTDVNNQEILSSIYDYLSKKNKTSKHNHEQKNTEEKQDDHTKQINQAKAKIAELLIKYDADYKHVSLHGNTALGYATNAHNIPLMNLLYEVQGMYHKIILEEDDNATDSDSPMSSEIVVYDSIIALSKANTEVALKNNIVIDPILVTTAINFPSKLVEDTGNKSHEVGDAEGLIATSVIPNLTSVYLTKSDNDTISTEVLDKDVRPSMSSSTQQEDTNFNIYACNSEGIKEEIIYTYANRSHALKACAKWSYSYSNGPSYYMAKGNEACSGPFTSVEGYAKCKYYLNNEFSTPITEVLVRLPQSYPGRTALTSVDIEYFKHIIDTLDSDNSHNTASALSILSSNYYRESVLYFLTNLYKQDIETLINASLKESNEVTDAQTAIGSTSLNSVNLLGLKTPNPSTLSDGISAINRALSTAIGTAPLVTNSNSELTNAINEMDFEFSTLLETNINPLSIYNCDSEGKKGAVIHTISYGLTKVMIGNQACANWAHSNNDNYLAKGTEACIGPLTSGESYSACMYYLYDEDVVREPEIKAHLTSSQIEYYKALIATLGSSRSTYNIAFKIIDKANYIEYLNKDLSDLYGIDFNALGNSVYATQSSLQFQDESTHALKWATSGSANTENSQDILAVCSGISPSSEDYAMCLYGIDH